MKTFKIAALNGGGIKSVNILMGLLILVALALAAACAPAPAPSQAAQVEAPEAAAYMPWSPVWRERPALSADTTKAETQVLRWGTYYGQSYPYPFETSAGYAVSGMLNMAFETLFWMNPDGMLEGRLAESFSASEDATVWTIKLKAGIQAADGEPFTAEDVKKSIELHASPNTGSRGTTYARFIQGYDAMRAEENPATELEGVRVVDDLTVEIELTKPFRDFGAILALPHRFLMAETSHYRPPAEGEMPWFVGHGATGPFMIATEPKWVGPTEPGSFELVPNPYWRGDAPVLEKVMLKYFADPQTALIAYENDEYDISEKYGPLEAAELLEPGRPTSDEMWPFQYEVSRSFYIARDLAPVDDVKVRQALAHAIDFKVIADTLLRGMWQPACQLIPLGWPGFIEGECHTPTYDPELARQLISESKYGSVENMPQIRLHVGESGFGGQVGHLTRIAQAMQQYWKQNLGLEVVIERSRDVFRANPELYQIVRRSYAARYPGLSSVCENADPMGTYNRSRADSWGPPAAEELCLKADTTMDLEEAIPLYQEAGRQFFADVYSIGHFTEPAYMLVKPWVSEWDSLFGSLDHGVRNPEHLFIAEQ